MNELEELFTLVPDFRPVILGIILREYRECQRQGFCWAAHLLEKELLCHFPEIVDGIERKQ
jgi:hypothetical protein